MKQQALYKIVGMQKDVADSAMDKQHAYDLHNLRLRHGDTNTVAALVNEIGNIKARTSEGAICNIKGTVIGTAVLNDIGILFTHEEDNTSYIQVDTIADENVNPIVFDDDHIEGGPLRVPSHPLQSWCCDYYIIAPDAPTAKEYRGNCVVNSDVVAGTTAKFDVHITRFNDSSHIGSDGARVAAVGGSGAILLRDINGSATTLEQNYFDIPQDVAQEISRTNDDYHFTIELAVPSSYEESQHISGEVSITAEYEASLDEESVIISPVVISFDCPIVAAQSVEPEPVEPEIPEWSGIPDYQVICDFPEETTTKQCDHIYLITLSEREGQALSDYTAVNVEEYFRGWLKFDTLHPIESTVYFENDEVKKVYWVDGKNPLRYANIAHKNGDTYWSDNLMFDSVPLLHLQEHVEVTRNTTGGVFPSGTVQWCFTYLNRYGAESNIAWISPIHYSSPDDRGGAPGETCSNSFTIKIDGYEPNGRFDYIRLYSIVHTTLDTEPQVRRIADISVPAERVSTVINEGTEEEQTVWYYPSVVYTDSNTTGETVDPNELLYLGGLSIIPNTIEQKSNTLFLGNLRQEFDQLRDVLDKQGTMKWGSDDVTFSSEPTEVPEDVRSGYYSHQNQLVFDSWSITSFRRGEVYRFGFQAQDKTGHWSDVWWVCDKENTDAYPMLSGGYLNTVQASCVIPSGVVNTLRDEGYQKVRPVVVYPEPWERNIYTEGLLNPTVYNVKDRASNAPFAQSSWFLRPFSPINMGTLTGTDNYGNVSNMPYPETSLYYNILHDITNYGGLWSQHFPFISSDVWHRGTDVFDYSVHGSWAEFRHNHPLGDSQQHNGEVQSMYNRRVDYDQQNPGQHSGYELTFPYLSALDTSEDFVKRVADFFYVDQSIVTMNSADIEFDQTLQAVDFGDCHIKITGYIPIDSFISSYDITVNTPPNKFFTQENNSMTIPQGFYGSEIIGAKMSERGYGWKSLISAGMWHDDLAYTSIKNSYSGYNNTECMPIGFAVYPWNCSGSLNNDSIGTRKVYPSNTGDDDTTKENDNESKNSIGDNYISAELKEKVLANLHYSHNTRYINSLSNAEKLYGDAHTVLDEQQVSLTKLKQPANSTFGSLHYFGSVDKLITPITEVITTTTTENEQTVVSLAGLSDYPLTRFGGYPKMVGYLPYCRGTYSNIQHLAFSSPYTPISIYNTLTGYNDQVVPISDNSSKGLKNGADRTMSSIAIKYKSCNHIVFSFNYDTGQSGSLQTYLGWDGRSSTIDTDRKRPFWSVDDFVGIKNLKLFKSGAAFEGCSIWETSYHCFKSGENNEDISGFLYCGQLCRNGEVANRFGGNSNEALEQNIWLPAGEAVYLEADTPVTVTWRAGDTYYQRYDALRTYPFTEEDVNKVVDIVSFMTETHTNIDGRYDKNRGLTNNNHCRPTNFNKLNYVYSQRDNFFTYHAINPNKVILDTFNYSFTWSLSKTAGALRDEWTRVTLANTYDCDGNKGSLNSITRLDNNLVAFQDGGVAQILFNENVQIQGSEGVPIELANSGKLQGLRYYTTEIGCQNKWSIAVFPNGIYWIDGRIRELCALGSEGIVPISKNKLMSTWFDTRKDLSVVWNPKDWNGFLSNCDKFTGEMFITGKDSCLCFDTSVGEFSSIYDYQQTNAMVSLSGNVLTIAQDRGIVGDLRHVYNKSIRYDHIWLHRKNKALHCNFYGVQYPFSIEVICNSNNQGSDYGLSKIFDNMSWRSDAWQWDGSDGSWTYKPFVTVTDMYGKNDYQTFSLHFDDVNGDSIDNSKPQLSRPQMPLNLRKKFKVWYTTIPRSEESKTESRPTGSDRIRDTWCHITLSADTSVSRFRHVLHDLSVTYFIP